MDARRRLPAAALVVGALIAAGAVLVVAGGLEEKDEPAARAATAAPRPEASDARIPARRPKRLVLNAPSDAYPVIWVRAGRRVEIRTAPRGGERVAAVDRKTEFGSPTVFGVVRTQGRWAAITTAALPNGVLGWVRLNGRRLGSGWTTLSIVVDLSERMAELRNRDRTVRSFPVTVGMPGAETPTGRYAVTDTFRGDLAAVYGCCALAISATQPNVPSGWLGGRRIAIHGTSGPLGVAASHGCVRAADRDVSALVNRVPLGTPVFIRG